ncbi:MAG: zinc finger protein, partial [Thermomicrobiales bacterium]|nr:zinc finger protein [Thermomicrobiales bacterium]
MNSSMIGKIEKAHRYAQEPERVRFQSLKATFHGGHDDHTVEL